MLLDTRASCEELLQEGLAVDTGFGDRGDLGKTNAGYLTFTESSYRLPASLRTIHMPSSDHLSFLHTDLSMDPAHCNQDRLPAVEAEDRHRPAD